MTSPQCELDGDVDDDVDRNTVTARGRKTPLPHGGDCLLVQPGAEAANDPNIRRAAIAADDDLEVNFALDPATPPLIRVVRTDFLNQAWRLDAASRTKGPTSGSAARSCTQPRSSS